VSESEAYESYLREEWRRFFADPARATAAQAAVVGVKVRRVLDVGCGAGQELFPFVAGGESVGVGVDRNPRAGDLARTLYACHAPRALVRFVQAVAEALPFRDTSFEVVICRLALPYVDNRRAIREMARVLCPGGVLLLKLHGPRFYLREMREALRTRRIRVVIHGLRVLAAGAIYHATGMQPRGRLLGGETCQTGWRLRCELARCGLRIAGELPDANPATPSYVIRHA
jgi:SAM-dependent methyltransferase